MHWVKNLRLFFDDTFFVSDIFQLTLKSVLAIPLRYVIFQQTVSYVAILVHLNNTDNSSFKRCQFKKIFLPLNRSAKTLALRLRIIQGRVNRLP